MSIASISATPDIRLVALDLDGTLLNRRHEVTPRTRAALAAATEKGVVILPATGRPLASIPLCVAQLPGLRYMLTSNGAAVYDLGGDPIDQISTRWQTSTRHLSARRVSFSPLSDERAQAVLATVRRFACETLVFVDGRNVIESGDMECEYRRIGPQGIANADKVHRLTDDMAAYLAAHPGRTEKFCIFFEDLEQKRAAHLALAALDGIELVQGEPTNLEVTAPGVSKGLALHALAAELGLDPQQVLAVGDSENDRELLRAAGVAAVMCNGMEHIKAEADYVTKADCNHDGVAEILERFVL